MADVLAPAEEMPAEQHQANGKADEREEPGRIGHGKPGCEQRPVAPSKEIDPARQVPDRLQPYQQRNADEVGGYDAVAYGTAVRSRREPGDEGKAADGSDRYGRSRPDREDRRRGGREGDRQDGEGRGKLAVHGVRIFAMLVYDLQARGRVRFGRHARIS